MQKAPNFLSCVIVGCKTKIDQASALKLLSRVRHSPVPSGACLRVKESRLQQRERDFLCFFVILTTEGRKNLDKHFSCINLAEILHPYGAQNDNFW